MPLIDKSLLPYCGMPPVPGHVVWNSDPWLVAFLFACAALYAVESLRQPHLSLGQQFCFWAGWAILGLALTSPLCSLSVALFSARVAQHVILTSVVTPLLVLGRGEIVLAGPGRLLELPRTLLRALSRLGTSVGGLAGAVVIFAVVLWAWHLPALYDATFHSTAVYWAMHTTMIGASLLLWSASLRGFAAVGAALFAVFATILQMSLLGGVLTFATRPLFAVHGGTTEAWGLSQWQDQQLGGLIMWIIGGFLLTAYALAMLARYMMRPFNTPWLASSSAAQPRSVS